MKLKFKLAAGVVSTLMFVGTAAAAVSYTPGTYEGEAIGRNGPVKVQVTVAKDRIESIRVVSHNESAGLSDAPINTLPKTIVDKQSLAVDVFPEPLSQAKRSLVQLKMHSKRPQRTSSLY